MNVAMASKTGLPAKTKAEIFRETWAKIVQSAEQIDTAPRGSQPVTFHGLLFRMPVLFRTAPKAPNTPSKNSVLIGAWFRVSDPARFTPVAMTASQEDAQAFRDGSVAPPQPLPHDMERLCNLAAGDGDSEKLLLDMVSRMAFLTAKEKENLIPRLKTGAEAWSDLVSKSLQRAGVDTDVLMILSRGIVSAPSAQSYAFYAKDHAPAEHLEARLEAVTHFPRLANQMASRSVLRRTIDQGGPLLKAIQDNSPLIDGKPSLPAWLVRRVNDLSISPPSPKSLRLLAQLPPDRYPKTSEDMIALNEITEAFMDLYPDPAFYANESASGWVAFRDSILLAFADTRAPEGVSPQTMAFITEAINIKTLQALSRAGKWDEIEAAADAAASAIGPFLPATEITEAILKKHLVTRFSAKGSNTHLSDIRAEMDHISQEFRDTLIVPASCHVAGLKSPNLDSSFIRDANETALKMLFGGRSIIAGARLTRSLLNTQTSRKSALLLSPFHGQEGMGNSAASDSMTVTKFHRLTNEEMEIQKAAGGWVGGRQDFPCMSPPAVFGDYVIVPLLSVDDISMEALSMLHCIGGSHVSSARNLLAFHYSLRRFGPNGVEPIITFTLGQNGDMTMINGYENSKVIPKTAMHVINDYVTITAAPFFRMTDAVVSQIAAEKLETANRLGIHPWSLICGYSWMEKDAFQPQMEYWQTALPKSFKGKTSQDFLESDAITENALRLDPAGRSSILSRLKKQKTDSLFAMTLTPYAPIGQKPKKAQEQPTRLSSPGPQPR